MDGLVGRWEVSGTDASEVCFPSTGPRLFLHTKTEHQGILIQCPAPPSLSRLFMKRSASRLVCHMKTPLMDGGEASGPGETGVGSTAEGVGGAGGQTMAGNEGLNFSFSCSPSVLLSSSERGLCYV